MSISERDRLILSVNEDIQRIPESIEWSRRSMQEPQNMDMNALRNEIHETISATIKAKLRLEADSVTTVTQSMSALEANTQYWSDLSNKAAHRSRCALELQIKMAEEKVINLLYEEASKVMILEAAKEVRKLRFQLDWNTSIHEAGLTPDQQVRFSDNNEGNNISPSGMFGMDRPNNLDIVRRENIAPLNREATPARSITAQLDEA